MQESNLNVFSKLYKNIGVIVTSLSFIERFHIFRMHVTGIVEALGRESDAHWYRNVHALPEQLSKNMVHCNKILDFIYPLHANDL